jgi:hypothetical protein
MQNVVQQEVKPAHNQQTGAAAAAAAHRLGVAADSDALFMEEVHELWS